MNGRFPFIEVALIITKSVDPAFVLGGLGSILVCERPPVNVPISCNTFPTGLLP